LLTENYVLNTNILVFMLIHTELFSNVNQSINQSCIFRVVEVTKSLQDPLEVGNNLLGISDNVRE